MSARGALQMVIVVLLALVCVGFVAVVGMSAAGTPADGGGDHGYDSTATDRPAEWDDEQSPPDDRYDDEKRRSSDDAGSTHVNVHTTPETITVTNRGDQPVDLTVDALSGDYDGVGDHRLAPGDSVALPAPDEPSRIRLLAESDDARLEVRLTFETYEYTCEEFAHSQVAPSSASYEFQAGGENRSRTQEFQRPPFECPSPPGDGGTPTPPGDGEPPQDPEDAYNETRERVFERYENGNESAWMAYEAIRQALWTGYEDGQSQFWQLYEQVMGDDDDDDGGDDDGGQSPPSEVNETRDFLERAGNQTQDDAERVANDTQDNAEAVANDTQGDVDRIRDDAEDGRDRIEEDVNETREELPPGDDNESDGGPSVPPEPPGDGPPEPPEDVPPEPPEDILPELPEDILPEPPGDGPPEPPEDVPPEPPEDVPPEPPEDVPPEPPEDVPPELPGDDNESDDNESDGGDPLPDGEAASVDADGDAGRDGDTVWAEGEADVVAGDGAAYAGVDEDIEVEGGSNA